MTMTTTTTKRDWTEHDAKIPYRDLRMWLLNGTNRAGRRPHSLDEPERPIRMEAANDNAVDFSQSGRAASVDGDQVELCTHPRSQLAA